MKQRVNDLAIFGGAPSFCDKLHVGKPNLGDRERFLLRVQDILDRRWFTNNGEYVQELEARISEFIGVRNCIAMCNGTIALEIAARALGLNGEVILPSFSFVATAHAMQWQQITPVFADIVEDGYTIDPRSVEKMITPMTTGIIGVHTWGTPCSVGELKDIADTYGLKLIFDAAHAFGCEHKGSMVGTFGDVEVYSFHATKFLNTFEGGAIVTNNDELAEKIRLMKNFGFSGRDNVIHVGTNGKMSEVSAAMGITSLESMADIVEKNHLNYKTYESLLGDIEGLGFITYDETEKRNYQYIVITVDAEKTGVSRDRLIEILQRENILARRYFYPGCHRMEPYRSYFPHSGMLLPNTERLSGRVISLPTGNAVSVDDIHTICQILRFTVEEAAAGRIHF
jgi:dTDP-4-amino-4,6-dideoxygalactose transaminase